MPIHLRKKAPKRLLTDLLAYDQAGGEKEQVNLRPSFLKRYRVPLAVVTTAIFVTSLFGTHLFTQAAVAYFHPEACLGTWEDVKKAQGKPNAQETSEIS